MRTAMQLVAILFLAICLVTFSPAAHQAFGGPPIARSVDAPGDREAHPQRSNAANPPSHLGVKEACNGTFSVPPLTTYQTSREPAAEPGTQSENQNPPISPFTKGGKDDPPFDEGGNGGISGHTLTDLEYQMFRKMVETSGATPKQVALVNAAVTGTSIFVVGLFWVLLLVLFRYLFNRWFDEDVYTKTWPSVVVISVMILCTALVLIAAVRG